MREVRLESDWSSDLAAAGFYYHPVEIDKLKVSPTTKFMVKTSSSSPGFSKLSSIVNDRARCLKWNCEHGDVRLQKQSPMCSCGCVTSETKCVQ